MADRRLRVFYTVARLLSFTRAAEALHMTQPAVTFQIRQLEGHFDIRLFDRAHNRVTLTEPGRRVYEYAERILGLYAEMEISLKELNRDIDGAITLGASDSVAESLLPTLLRDFKRERPDVNLRLKIVAADEIVHMVKSSAIDVGVVDGVIVHDMLKIQRCHVDQMVIIVQPGHPLAGHERLSAQVLARYPLIGREAGSRVRTIISEYVATSGMDAHGLDWSLELGSVEAIKGAVEAGMGVAIVPRMCVARETELGSLICVEFDPPLRRSFSFVCQQTQARTVAELLAFAHRYAANNGQNVVSD